MGPRSSARHSIDRINGSKGYEPSNCRWATSVEQGRNRCDNRMLTFNGLTMCVSEWAEKLGMSAHTLSRRLQHGWSVERALTEPISAVKQLAGRARWEAA